jgi:ribosomal protein L40E
MKGPLRRILPARRPSDPEPAPPDAQVTIVEPPSSSPAEPLPAGTAPPDAADLRPTFRDRGRLRRRLRYLRRVRELGFRDLGGLVFDLHRFTRRNDDLVLGKLAALDAVDRELRAIERVLDERRDIIELREPGVAACPRCGALHGSDARFCPQCGTQLTGPLALGTAVGGPPADAPRAVSATQTGATPVSAALDTAPLSVPPPPVEQPTVSMPVAAPVVPAPSEDDDGAPRSSDDGAPRSSGDPLAHGKRPPA